MRVRLAGESKFVVDSPRKKKVERMLILVVRRIFSTENR